MFVLSAMLSSDQRTPELHRIPVSASRDQWSVTWLAGRWMIWYRDRLLLLGYPDVDSEYFYTEFFETLNFFALNFLRHWIFLHWIFWDVEFFYTEFLRHGIFLHLIFLNIKKNVIGKRNSVLEIRWLFKFKVLFSCKKKFSVKNLM